MARLEDAIATLGKRRREGLLQKYNVGTVRQLANHYKRHGGHGGWRDFIRELTGPELRKSLTVLKKRELQAVVFGALAFEDKVKTLIPPNHVVGNRRNLRGIMRDLCGWADETFQQATYDALIEMLNRVGVDVEERKLKQLKQAGKKAADRTVRLRRMFAD